MPRDDQRPASRLSPPRANYEWAAESRSTSSPRGYSPSRRLEWEDDAGEFESPNARYEEEVVEGDFTFEEETEQPLVFRHHKPGARHKGGSYDPPYEPPIREERVDTAPRLTPPPVANAPLVPKKEVLLPEETQEDLSVQERHQLLIHMIELYDDLWKLAGIRANEKKDRLEAYLIPRSQRMDLREAISKNIALVITIDSRGNTDIREPKGKSAWRKFTTWLFGS